MKITEKHLSILTLTLLLGLSAFGQDKGEIEILVEQKMTLNSHELKIENNSDSLLIILFSKFYGKDNSPSFVLKPKTLSDTIEYDLIYSDLDAQMDTECIPSSIITINPNSSKKLTIFTDHSDKTKKLIIYHFRVKDTEEKFLKNRPKRCLERHFKLNKTEKILN